jgi:NAD(P)-dependent dehydrogenase (short-subunit alcohol dehydrogenase family)
MGLLDDKIALITGGTTGIGLATAKRFHAEGATVIVTGRNPDTLQAARDALPATVHVWRSDAADPDAVAALAGRVRETVGHLDVLFLNAGIAQFAPIDDHSLDSFDAQFSVNVRGPWLALKHLTPLVVDHGSVFVNGSIVKTKGMAGSSAYAGTKAAVRSIVRVLAAELAPRGVRVNTLSPGPIQTPIYGKMGMPVEQVEAFGAAIQGQVPLGRFGQPDEIAGAALFLASGLSSYVTGIDLAVDGGMAQV